LLALLLKEEVMGMKFWTTVASAQVESANGNHWETGKHNRLQSIKPELRLEKQLWLALHLKGVMKTLRQIRKM
jgi:ribosomal protein S10